MILEKKRHIVLFALAWIFGTVLYCRREDIWPAVLILAGAVLFYGIATGGRRREQVIVFGLILGLIVTAFAVCRCQDRREQAIQNILETDPGAELTGTVVKKEIRSDQTLYYLKTSYKKVIVYSETDEVSIGSVATVRGKWNAFSHATNEGAFDYAQDYFDRGISFRVYADSMTVESEPLLHFREGLYRLQKRVSEVFAASLNAREAGVLSQLCLGNKGLMDPEVKELYQDAGLSHILAISGLHISILGFGIYRFLRRIRIPCHVCEGVGCGIIFCFVVMSGMSVSAVRALVMYLLLMGAYAAGRTYDPLNALALAALVLLVPDPTNLYRSGFQFSFLAMAAITLFGEISRRMSEEKKKREKAKRAAFLYTGPEEESLPQRILVSLKGRLFFTVFLQAAMLPLTAWYYYEVPVYAAFLNFLLLPLCSALLGFGLAGGLLGIFLPQAAKWLLVPSHVILRIYEGAVTLVGRLPFCRWITGKPSGWMILAFYLALIGVCVLYLARAREKVRANLSCVVPIALLACLLFVPKRQYCRVDFLDVGQGDGICLADGAGRHVMIDGGSSSESSVGTYEIEPFLKFHGIRKVDAWILTHGDSDHYSGLLEILEDGYPVDYLVLADAMPKDETWEALTAAADANGTEVVYVEAGDGIALEGCTMTCLYPAAEDGGDAAEDGNELSLVWLFEKGEMSMLFTGDIGEEQERLLLERDEVSGLVVLKVAHHGSKYSSSAEFLARASPEYAVISCGENNIYGHPAPETLERLADAGCEIYQTPQSGQITFYEKRGKWKLRF